MASGDAHHITAPAEDGSGGYRADGSGPSAQDAGGRHDYINAHATLDAAGDEPNLARVKRMFGQHASSSPCPRPSRRSAICTMQARSRRSSRSSRWDQGCAADPQPHQPVRGLRYRPGAQEAQRRSINSVLSNSFRLRRHQRQPDFRWSELSCQRRDRPSCWVMKRLAGKLLGSLGPRPRRGGAGWRLVLE